MIGAVALFVWGLCLAVLGAELFVRSASAIAARLGIPPVVVGLTIVAWGTSSPELAVSVRAALQAEGGVALGNVVGSNIFNVGIILGLAACIRSLRVELDLIRQDAPILIGATVLFSVCFIWAPLSRLDGLVLVVAFLAYSVMTITGGRRDAPAGVVEEFERQMPHRVTRVWFSILGVLGGLGLLLHGGDLLVRQAITLAHATGVSERVVGLTIVAAGTSLPELLTSVIAAVRRSADIAVGNIIGSNIFNLTAVPGLASLVGPIDASGLASLDLMAVLASSLILLPVMRTGFTITRWEGALLLLAYGGYATLLVA